MKLAHHRFAIGIAALLLLSPFTLADELETPNPLSHEARDQKLQAFQSEFNSTVRHSSRPTHWADIHSWKRLGNRFAMGYDQNANPVALYDLSYPALLSGITLGAIGDPRVKRSDLSRSWQIGLAHRSSLPTVIQKAVNALGNQPEKVFAAIEPPRDWWKTLPWKTRAPVSAPNSFTLADLDPARLKLNPGFMKKLRGFYAMVLDEPSGSLEELDDSSLLTSIGLRHSVADSYEVTWQDPRGRSATPRPRKVLDFKYPREGFYDNVTVELAGDALEEATSAIPLPIISALVSTVISRVSRYYTMTLTAHMRMLREVMTENSEGSLSDPVLAGFSAKQSQVLVDTFEWTDVTPDEFWTWLFANPDKAWARNLREDAACAKTSRDWIARNERSPTDINARFSSALSSGNEELLFLDTDPCPVSKRLGPTLSINSHTPELTADRRAMMEAMDFGVNFASNFIPIVGFLVSDAYDWLVQGPIDRSQYVESQLIQHLELRPDRAQWEDTLAMLAHQRINPFEPSPRETERLIDERLQMIGL